MISLNEFFVFTYPGNNVISGQCKFCEKSLLDKVGSTGNFHKHLKRKHNAQLEESKSHASVPPTQSIDENSENFTSNINRINKAILEELIVRCNLPPSLVEHVGFRKFLKGVVPKWKPTSARYFTRILLPSLMNNIQDKIKDLLTNVDHICITVDVWTDRRGRSFLGITGHFLGLDYVPHALLLDFLRLKGSHTGENIYNVTVKVLDNLKLKEKVFRIITDNASSMIKAYKFGLIVNDVDNIVQDANKQQQADNFIKLYDDDNSNLLKEWILVDWYENINDSFDKNDTIPKRLSCFAHSIQLVIRDGLKDAPYLSNSLSKCIKLAQRSYKSTRIADMLDDMGKTINRPNITRWSSEYLLIKSVIAFGKNLIDEITDLIDDNDLKFSNNDFIVLQEAIEILEPFAEITSRIQSESVVTASLVVPSVVHIIDHLQHWKSHAPFLKQVCIQLEQSINNRFAGIVKRLSQQNVNIDDPFSDPIYFICTVLDPEFKFYWLTQMNYKPLVELQIRQSIIRMILDECEQNINRSSESEQPLLSSIFSANSSTTQPISTPIIKKRKLFQYDDGPAISVGSTSPIDEINAYINDPVRLKFSSYWNKSNLYHLKNIVKKVFSVQATSAPVERIFSQAGLIMSPRRTSMNEEVFRNLLFSRVNQNLI
ncbi:unnamed protein product [Rotaria sp. Silwood2]|nr:unnamed protein product [Rotaria sp. Silwood2]CAF2915180.1 unnamed protein product [Rotaria sp. Silwood2]CAF3204135.1 unnamed protein product [Rotaria sp. Silwood2]CAF3302737.1 unnamed protein product [Rotaria sp. Silwood2]CAF4163612.1 unnamed protein product [Rotaria sp. Silwood2]